MLEHFHGVIDCAEARRFRTDQRTAVRQALAGQNAVFKRTLDAPVLAVEIADFAAAYADIAGRHVHIGADMAIELGHKRLAETHDLRVAFAARIEIGAAFCAADRQTGQRVFEDLFKTKELHDAEIDRRMEAQTALVGTDCAVELDAVAFVDLHIAVVVDPSHAEFNHAFGLDQTFEQRSLAINSFVFVHNHTQRFEHLFDGLVEFGFTGVVFDRFCDHFVNV